MPVSCLFPVNTFILCVYGKKEKSRLAAEWEKG